MPHEVIAIDGGSIDDTAKLFEENGALLIHSEIKGRGNQIKRGLEEVSGDAVLILHADMLPQKNVIEKVAVALNNDPHLIGGNVGASFTDNAVKYKVITFLNRLRVALTGISFGDQGQFFRREAMDCVQPIPLMEDVELAMRLQKRGKTVQLDGGLEVSVRRWQKKKVLSNAFHIFFLLSRYLFMRRLKQNLKLQKLYKEYYAEDIETA